MGKKSKKLKNRIAKMQKRLAIYESMNESDVININGEDISMRVFKDMYRKKHSYLFGKDE